MIRIRSPRSIHRLSSMWLAVAIVLCSLIAKPQFSLGQTPTDKPQSPIEPKESIQWIQCAPGYRVELVACEPQVIDPVDVAFGDDGSMWVVEMSDYPRGPTSPNEPPKGRIRRLRDGDGDGFFETAETFADQLLFPTGIQLWQRGAIVTAAGQLLYLEDSDGDGQADVRRVWMEGFAQENSQLRANHPTWAWNQWLYVANGLRGGEIAVHGESESAAAQKFQLGSYDLRFEPLSRQSELITGVAQFGLTFDDAGYRYVCSNRNPCIEILIEQSDVARSPLAGISPLIGDSLPAAEQSVVRPLADAWTTSNLHAGQFTAACGVLMTSSRFLPSSSAGHVLVCEPTGSLVHHRQLTRSNGRTLPADELASQEFVASRDSWFRPVNLKMGPDDAVYIVDMYRAVIEHPDWVPEELQHRPDERFGDDRGRIYRIVKSDTGSSASDWRSLSSNPLSQQSLAELAKLVDHPYRWYRETASRLLFEKSLPDECVPMLKNICLSGNTRDGKMRAAALLDRFQRLDQATFDGLLNDADASVQAAMWRGKIGFAATSETSSVKVSAVQIQRALNSGSFDVQLAASWALSDPRATTLQATWSGNRETIDPLVFDFAAANVRDGRAWMAVTAKFQNEPRLLFREVSERAMEKYRETTMSGLAEFELTWLALERLASTLPGKPDPSREPTIEREQIARWIANTAKELADSSVSVFEKRWRLACVKGILKGPFADAVRSDRTFWEQLVQLSQANEIDESFRAAVVDLFAWGSAEIVTPALFEISKQDNPMLTRRAVAAWAYHDDDRLAAFLLERLPSASPQDRIEFFSAIVSSEKRLAKFLESIESGSLSIKILDATQMQRLRSVQQPTLAPRINKILEGAVQADRAAVVEKYKPCLELQSDLDRGKALFLKHCSACHKIGNDGFVVGPDISDSRVHIPAQLLISILDPNRAIDNNYFRYVAITEDGQVVEGVMTEATAHTVTLRGQNAKVITLNRSEITEFKATGVSLMPEGIEAQISPQDMADLIGYIKNWRYLNGTVPAEIIKN
jgi:putative membrane-bound dehydrogenase-like protein